MADLYSIQSQRYRLSGVAVSKQGGRPENQDDLGWADTPLGFLLVVCDGMGGGPGGKTASYIAKNVFLSEMVNSSPQAPPEEALKRAVSQANDALYSKMRENPSLQGMGSTLVAVLVSEQSALVAHLGDSRCYQVRGSQIRFRTKDHSLVGELVKNKALTEEQARQSPQSNIIMRGLGSTSNHVAEIQEVAFRKGDRFLLCSDGVWGIMPHDQLAQRLTSMQDMASLVGNLSAEVDQRGFAEGGHHDNHTMAVIELNMNSKVRDKMDKISKIIIAVLGVLLLLSVLFNLTSLKGDGNNASEVEALNKTLAEKNNQIAQLESYQKLYDDMKEAGSKELITRVEVLEYEKASLQEYIDELMTRIDELEKKVAAQGKSKEKPQARKGVTAQETAQKIINRLSSMQAVSGKDYARTLGQKAKYRNEIVALLQELNQQTGQSYKSTIDGVVRELNHPHSQALLVGQQNDKTYVSTQTAVKQIQQLSQKVRDIQNKCKTK